MKAALNPGGFFVACLLNCIDGIIFETVFYCQHEQAYPKRPMALINYPW